MTPERRARLEERAYVGEAVLRAQRRLAWSAFAASVVLCAAGARPAGVFVLLAGGPSAIALVRRQWALGELVADAQDQALQSARVPLADLRDQR